MESTKKVPTRRFKGFTDVWEQRKLGKLGNTFTGLTGKTKEDFGHGNAKFVTYVNVFSNSITDLEMTENVEIDDKQNTINYGDIFFTTSSETPEEVGMSSVWLGNEVNVYLNSFCFGYRPTAELNPYYMAFMLRSPSIRKKFMFLAQGISRYNISKTKVMEMEVSVPSLDEQTKIGNFFKQLDDTIALHQRKLNKLKNIKQAYLQEMFPAEGETKPKRRFEGFNDDWEQRKLGDISQIMSGGTPSTSTPEFWNGDIDWYSPVEIGEQIFVKGSQKKITELGLQKSSAKILPVGTILFTSRAGIGNTAILAKEGCTNQGFQSIVPGDELDSYFIFSRTNELKRYGEANGAGSTFTEISGKQMAKMPILIPKMAEQKKIGAFFKSLDDTIALQEQKLTKLQQLKSAYLEEMFV